ncbi:TPA: hypothetical protein ACRTM3_003920, partial [Aeromonas hydrophila]
TLKNLSVGLRYALCQLTKTTLPPLNSSLQSAAPFPVVWLWSGIWLLRQEGICWPCYRTEPFREGGVDDFSGKINKLSCHGVVVGRWGDLSALACSVLAAYLDGGMNCGAVTLLSEV